MSREVLLLTHPRRTDVMAELVRAVARELAAAGVQTCLLYPSRCVSATALE